MASADGTRSQPGAGLKETLKRDGLERLQSGKRHAAEQIEDIADAIDSAGIQLDRSQPTLAGYASRVADQVGVIAGRLREGSVEDLAREARQIATRNPGMFLLGSAAVGLFVARFLMVSSESEPESAEGDRRDDDLMGEDLMSDDLVGDEQQPPMGSDARRSMGDDRPQINPGM